MMVIVIPLEYINDKSFNNTINNLDKRLQLDYDCNDDTQNHHFKCPFEMVTSFLIPYFLKIKSMMMKMMKMMKMMMSLWFFLRTKKRIRQMSEKIN